MNRLNKEIVAAHERQGQLQESVGADLALVKALLTGLAAMRPEDVTPLDRQAVDLLCAKVADGRAEFKAVGARMNRLMDYDRDMKLRAYWEVAA